MIREILKTLCQKKLTNNLVTTKKCINEYLDKTRNEINIYNLPIDPKKINKIRLIACGTAYHSCLMAKYWIRRVNFYRR